MKKDIKKNLGLSILEALVSTEIIGIGFVAILQMTNYSVQSIYSSGERTKANYLTNLIAEDLGEASKDALAIREKYNIPGMSILQYMLNENENAWYDIEKTVLYTGTHDNDTIWGWYDHIRKDLSKKELETVNRTLNIDPKEVKWSMIEYSLHSNAYLVIVPIQDIMGLGSNARMNKPGQGFYKVLAESALRAVKLCQPLRVPTTGYERWKELQLNFDAREMLEG